MNKQPNLIYVFADQLRWDCVGYHGNLLAPTPNIDALASMSCDAYNAVSGHPVCAPYRASLMTGKYTTSTGMVINEIRLNPNHKCFAHVLNEGGYETAYIGKWHMYAAQFNKHDDPSSSFIPKGEDRLGFNDYFAAYNFHHKYFAPNAYYHLDTPEKHFVKGYEPDFQTDLAIEQLSRLSSKDKPFALFLSLGTPHDPWNCENVPEEYLRRVEDLDIQLPPNYKERNDPYSDLWAKLNKSQRKQLCQWIKVYYAMIANLDDNIGRLVKAINALGIEENSILVFTSDHGEMFGSHGRRAKNIFYEEAVRVPFLLRNGSQTVLKRNDVCLNTVDIMPTLLSMMGLPLPDGVEGTDLSKTFTEQQPAPISGALMMGTGPTAIFGDNREWRAWRTERYTYATYRKDNSEYLFDNKCDPYQLNNLWDKMPQLKNKLRAEMLKKMSQIGDGFEKNSFYKKHWVKNRKIKRQLPRREQLEKKHSNGLM